MGEDDFADAVAVANGVADLSEDAGHLGVFEGEDALAREQEFEEDGPEECGSGYAADYGEDEDQRCCKDAEVVQEIPCSTEPAEEGRMVKPLTAERLCEAPCVWV